MSTDYEPSDPPTVEDWRQLAERSERNRKRSRRGQILAAVAVALVVAVGAGGGLIYVSQKDVPSLQRKQAQALDKLNVVAAHLAENGRQQKCQSSSNAAAFALILHDLAAAFGTPPAPDPNRQKAVAGLNATADLFDMVAKHPPADACPH